MKTDGAAIMLQFECCKCEHVRDLWSSGSRELTDSQNEKVASGEMKARTPGEWTRLSNHDLYTAANWADVGTKSLKSFMEGVDCPHAGTLCQKHAGAVPPGSGLGGQ